MFQTSHMNFRIADTFTDSLARLTSDEQKLVKTTAFDLQIHPANPGMQFHKLAKAKDKNFWSVRVGSDLRLIVHKSQGNLLLCYVDHHDRAYDWAERRKLETHPKTGAAQLVEVRETVQEIRIPTYVESPQPVSPKLPLFAGMSDDDLLTYGVPPEWMPDVRQADEDSLLALADRLPGEAAEALLDLATGGKPLPPQPVTPVTSPFDHPDALRRFRVMTNVEELERALEFPWDKWSVFLHPEQRQLVERHYTGPARVSGSAGTGKTIVALHRAVFLARANQDARVLLTTFSDILANALRTQLRRLISNEPRLAERLEVHSIDGIGEHLYKSHCGPVNLAPREVVHDVLHAAAAKVGNHKFSAAFLLTEWEQVVDAWQLDTWEAYRDVVRLGRKTRLSEARRAILWSMFERVRAGLASRNMITRSAMFTKLATAVAESRNPPFDFTVVDEAQDIGVAHLRFFAGLGWHRPDALFFAGDLGQRIFQQPFSWLALGACGFSRISRGPRQPLRPAQISLALAKPKPCAARTDRIRPQPPRNPSTSPAMAVSSAEIAAKTERATLRPCPCKLRGVPIPVSDRIQMPRLYPQAWINKRFRMFSCPRKYTRRSPPLPYMWAIDRSAFSVRCFPNSRPRSPPTRSRFASTVFWTSSLPSQLRFRFGSGTYDSCPSAASACSVASLW